MCMLCGGSVVLSVYRVCQCLYSLCGVRVAWMYRLLNCGTLAIRFGGVVAYRGVYVACCAEGGRVDCSCCE